MAETIEDAFEALEERCGQRMKLDTDAARALALAVLEEAANEEGNPFPLEGEGYAKLQRRIEALGK